eukprot:60170_1
MADEQLSDAQTQTYNSLINMGFTKEQSLPVARIFGSNVDDAINYVLDNPPSVYNHQTLTSNEDTFDYFYKPMDNDVSKININTHDAPTPIFRINYISQLFITGVFHESCAINQIFPSDVQNIILKYVNLLFAKLCYNIDNKPDEKIDHNENNIHYLSFEKDISLGEIALLIENNNNYQYDDEKTKDCDYAQFIHLWLKFKKISFIYPESKIMSGDQDKNNISDNEWVELPADAETETLNRLDQIIDDENIFVEIAIEKYNQKLNKWSYQSHDDFSEESLRKCDIIDAFCKKHNKWFESVVLHVGDVKQNNFLIQVHYIGLNAEHDTFIPRGPRSIQYEYVRKRGCHTNGPDRANWWRGLFKEGYKLDAYDRAYNKWYRSQIVEIGKDKNTGKVKIHFDGYSSNYDEWHDRDSGCLALLNQYTYIGFIGVADENWQEQ